MNHADLRYAATVGGATLNGEYGNDFISLIDDDGNEFEVEHLGTVEIGNGLYMAFLPADMDEDDEDYGIIILKVSVQDDEEILITLEDENELEMVYECFIERLSEENDE